MICREGLIYADACATSCDDDFNSLAEELSLDFDEYHLWAQTEDLNVVCGKHYKIPNVMVAYTSKPQWVKDGIFSVAYNFRRKVRDEANEYKSKGFKVVIYWLSDSEQDFIAAWNMAGIYAISFAGHGSKYGYIASPSSGFAVSPSEITIRYHLASVHGYSCMSADSVSDVNGGVSQWRDFVAYNGSFVGYTGWAWPWSKPVVDDNGFPD